MHRASPLALILATVLLAACGKAPTDTASTAPAATPAPAAAPAATPPPAATTAAPAATASADRIGIAACDDYLDKYQACVADKVPAEARASFESSLAATRSSWKSMAGNTATSASLETACKQAVESTKQAMASYGCQF